MKTMVTTTILGLAVGAFCMYHFTPEWSYLLSGVVFGFTIGVAIAVTAARKLPKTDVILDSGQLISAIPGKNDFGDFILCIVWKDKSGFIKTENISPNKRLVKVLGRTPHVLAWEATITKGEPWIKKIQSVLKDKSGWAVEVDEECRFEVSMPETSFGKGFLFPLV